MCAICGILNFDHFDAVDPGLVSGMAQTLYHRGPDDDGLLTDGNAALGFRRLSIIDRDGGHQPIFNEDRSAAIVFNGEIYNFRQLRSELRGKGHRFATFSDTETILHAWEEYGESCVDHLRGMFAFAIWDKRARRLFIARDRVGIKPLYYYRNSRFLAFASEIKALLRVPGVPAEVDPEALDQYLSLRYVPGPRTMFRNIFCLMPGHTMTADQSGTRIRQYWDLSFSECAQSPDTAPGEFTRLLDECVSMHLISEVPLGVALSGGLDSSAILATMNRLRRAEGTAGPIKTFSVGYEGSGEEKESSELDYARLVANAFGSDHYEYKLSAPAFAEFIPQLVWNLDQPLADPSCIPLHYVTKLAREHVTVILSGEGADEILGGYNIYSRMLAMNRIRRTIPFASRLAPAVARLIPSEKIRRYAVMCGQNIEDAYRGVCRGFGAESLKRLIGPQRAAAAMHSADQLYRGYFRQVSSASPLNRMLYADSKAWLPDDLLLKADKITMGNSLELRVPFLDHRMIEFASALPGTMKIGPDGSKALLRRAMRGVLPDAILDRPKKGFTVPLSAWLRGPLHGFASERLLASDSACRSWFDTKTVSTLLREHEHRTSDRSQEIWALLVFEVWHRHFMKNSIERSCAA